MLMTTGKLLCLLALFVSCVSSVTVTLSDGIVEVETNKWQVNVYVRQFDNTTRTWIRVPSFSWEYHVERVVEYWSDKRDFECLANINCTLAPLPYNYSLTDPAVESTAVERTFTTDYPDGAKATNFERRVRLPNGASYIQTFITFDRDSYKDVSGWKLPVGPDGVKIVSKFENWPLTTLDPRPDPAPASNRRLLIQGYMETKMLPREDSSLIDFENNSPFTIAKTRPLTEAISNPPPSTEILLFDLIFRHRQFNMSVGFLQNTTRCNSTTDETTCEWLPTGAARIFLSDTAGIYRELTNQIGGLDYDRNSVLTFRTGLFIGLKVGAYPHGEWDPNLGLIFDESFQTTISSGTPGTASTLELQIDQQQRNIAIGVSLSVVAVVVGGVVIAGIVYKKRMNERARVQLANIRASSLEQPTTKPKPTATVAAEGRPQSSKWSTGATPSGVRNTFSEDGNH